MSDPAVNTTPHRDLDALTGEERLRLHVHDPDTFAFTYEDAEKLVDEIAALPHLSSPARENEAVATGDSYRCDVSVIGIVDGMDNTTPEPFWESGRRRSPARPYAVGAGVRRDGP